MKHKKITRVRVFKRALLILFFVFFFSSCGFGIPNPFDESGNDVDSSSDTRTVTGTLSSSGENAGLKALGSEDYSGCGVDSVMALNADGKTEVSDVKPDCSFELNLKIGKSYVISFTHMGKFIATMTFNKIASSLLPITKDKAPLDLGNITIIGNRAVCDNEEEVICPIDSDDDGVSLCDDDDELENGEDEDMEEDDSEEEAECDSDHKVNLCHVPPGDPDNAHTICVDVHSVRYVAHLKHGDTIGECYGEEGDEENEEEAEEDDEYECEDDSDDDYGYSEEMCSQPVRAKLHFIKVKNWNYGDLLPQVFLGAEKTPVRNDEWFDLIDETGRVIKDDSMIKDVPGVSIKRGRGWMHVNFWGHHPYGEGKEALIASLVVDGAKITRVANSRYGRFERQGDGMAIFGMAGQDEFIIKDRHELKMVATVTVHHDGFTVFYHPRAWSDECYGYEGYGYEEEEYGCDCGGE